MINIESYKKDLVSLVIPCYNMGKRIHRLLDSIINQTYDKIQVIIVNDGSTDDSESVILNYKERIESRGYTLNYILQENAGLGGAINRGLKEIEGEFFCWPDADDWLTHNSVERKVNFLKENVEYGFVRSDAFVYYESDFNNPVSFITFKNPFRFKANNYVEDYIWERNIIFCPGCHMIRTKLFRKIIPSMEIYPGRRGQNYQLLLPMLCFHKFGYIDEALYNYVIYEGSMSKGDDSMSKTFFRYKGLEDIMVETFKSIPLSEDLKKKYLFQTNQKYYVYRTKVACSYGNEKAFWENYNCIDERYLSPRLKKLASIVQSPLKLKWYVLTSRINTSIRNTKLKYILKKIMFKKQAFKYNDFPK